MSAVRLATLFVAGFGIVLLVGWAAMLWFVDRELHLAIDRELVLSSETTLAFWQSNKSLPQSTDDDRLYAARLHGRTIAGPKLPRKLWSSEGIRDWGRDDDEPLRVLVHKQDELEILVGLPTERVDEVREIINVGFGWMFAIGLAAISLLAFAAARQTQQRIATIEAGLARIAAGHFDTRFAPAQLSDDLDRVSASIDHTTARTQRLLEQLRTQAANIAHDLRTPLARLRAKLESEIEDQNQPPANLVDALEQADDIIGSFNALLRIAAVESGARRAGFRVLDFAQLAHDVDAAFTAVAEDQDRQLIIRHARGTDIRGDAELLLQLIGNLIQNALRYAQGDIELQIGPDCIEIEDLGPGIPSSERQRVLEPLYRTDKVRQSPGSGLGLTLVRAIAELHDADLQLAERSDGRSGLRVVVRFA